MGLPVFQDSIVSQFEGDVKSREAGLYRLSASALMHLSQISRRPFCALLFG